MRFIFIAAAAVLLPACGEQSTIEAADAASLTKPANTQSANAETRIAALIASRPAIDRTTPDRAVQSLWALRDWQAGFDEALGCFDLLDVAKPYNEASWEVTAQIFGGSIKRQLEKRRNCGLKDPNDTARVFSRSIVEVKMETPTRAVVETMIKNITPIPEKVKLDDDDKRKRDWGQATRYVLSKDSESSWAIDNVLIDDGPLYWMNGEARYSESDPAGHYEEVLSESEEPYIFSHNFTAVSEY